MATKTLPRKGATPQLPNFIITDQIGSGSYATVYKAYRKSGVRDVVAVKCVSKLSLNNTTKENLLTEIELLKTLHHEHIVTLKDFTWDDSYIYLMMEYCGGGDLATLIRSKRILTENIVRRFLQQLASALQYMRTKHVSHMDLKPSNILLSSTHDPQLKIGDFGFAHYLVGDTEAEFLRGSLLYMAPEIVICRQYNEKADLWSVGVILFECLFGRAPFASRTLQDLRTKILDTVPIEIPTSVEISDNCRDLLTRLLQRDPEQRINYEDFLDHPFLDFEHRPCPDALRKAKELVTRAVSRDGAEELPEAIGLYCESLAYFIPAIQYEKDATRKQMLREKVTEYMHRAEELQRRLKPATLEPVGLVGPADVRVRRSLQPIEELEQLSADCPQLLTAYKLVRSAESAERREEFKSAFDRYEQSFDILITQLQSEPSGRRRELLQSETSRWMSRAEAIKRYLAVQNDRRTKQLQEAQAADDSSSISSYCSIQ